MCAPTLACEKLNLKFRSEYRVAARDDGHRYLFGRTHGEILVDTCVSGQASRLSTLASHHTIRHARALARSLGGATAARRARTEFAVTSDQTRGVIQILFRNSVQFLFRLTPRGETDHGFTYYESLTNATPRFRVASAPSSLPPPTVRSPHAPRGRYRSASGPKSTFG